jgi:hypothetical protein
VSVTDSWVAELKRFEVVDLSLPWCPPSKPTAHVDEFSKTTTLTSRIKQTTHKIPGQYETSNEFSFSSFPSVSPNTELLILIQPLRSNSSKLESIPMYPSPSSVIGHRANRNTRIARDRFGCSTSIAIPLSDIWRHHPNDNSSINSKSWRLVSPSSVMRSHYIMQRM